MAATVLSDVIDNTEMADYIFTETTRMSGLDQSAASKSDDVLQEWLEGDGGMKYENPSWDSIDRDAAELTINETAPVVFGGTAPTPQGIATHLETAVRVERAQVFSATKLAKYFNKRQRDPIDAIVSDLAGYWAFRKQAMWLAMWAGIFADNDAAPGGTEHVQGDLTHDVSNGGSFVEGQTNFTARNFLQALQKMGDKKESLGLIMMHSLTHTIAAENDLIDFTPESRASGGPGTFMGRPIIINDEMPGTGNLRHTYIFGSGVVGMSAAMPDVPFEIARYADGGNGAGQDAVWTRIRWCMHPYGHRFIGNPTANTGGPTNAATSNNLANAGSWIRTVPERKQVKVVRLLTQELPA